MEKYSADAIRKSMRLFFNLVEKSKIRKSDDSSIFEYYEDAEVSELMGIYEEETGVLIIRTGDTLYFTPKTDNRLFGYSNEELRDNMNLSNNTELYAAYIVMLSLMIKFYNGENYNTKCRTVLKIEELERFITTKMETFSDRNDGTIEDEQIGFNFTGVAKFWLGLPAYDEKISSFSRSSGTKISIIAKALKFMKDQGYLNIVHDSDIFTTEKFDVMATAYYPESSRKNELLSYIENISRAGEN